MRPYPSDVVLKVLTRTLLSTCPEEVARVLLRDSAVVLVPVLRAKGEDMARRLGATMDSGKRRRGWLRGGVRLLFLLRGLRGGGSMFF